MVFDYVYHKKLPERKMTRSVKKRKAKQTATRVYYQTSNLWQCLKENDTPPPQKKTIATVWFKQSDFSVCGNDRFKLKL